MFGRAVSIGAVQPAARVAVVRRPRLGWVLAWWRAEPLLVVCALSASTGFVLWNLLRGGLPLSLDTSSQYWPWYVYLGDQLRSGHLPEWNPSAFGGAPFAADPLSGWTYLPSMVLFTLLPSDSAIWAFLIGHLLLAAVSMYGLARVLDLDVGPALLTGLLYACSGFVQYHVVAAPPYVGVAAWLPVALLGVEWAVRAGSGYAMLRGWSVAGIALSQALAVWPGQGSYYAVLLVATWTLARASALAPRRALAHVCGPIVIGGLLAAAGLLPRLELQSLSNLAGGYAQTDLVGGWQVTDYVRLITPGPWHAGLLTLCASLVGLATAFRARRWPFVLIAGLWVGGLILASARPTPLHALLVALLPGFAQLHPHISERVLVVTYVAPALLAGLGLQELRRRFPRHAVHALVAGLAMLELIVAGRAGVDSQIGAEWDALTRVERYSATVARTPAAEFLRTGVDGRPFRFMGFAPLIDGAPVPYTQRFASSATRALLVNNRAITLGLEDMQGYNAVHLARYDAFLRTVNRGRTQNYHDGQVFAVGDKAPLLDLLGVRFVVVPSDASSGDYPTVYQDAQVRILERPSAFPRAWRVDEAEIAPPDEALLRIDSGAVDPRHVVLLEEPPPAPAAGYIVFSQPAYPGWTAYVDGRAMRPLRADGMIQAVPLPPGAQHVEWRFESTTLRLGLVISAITLACLAAALIGAARVQRRRQLAGWPAAGAAAAWAAANGRVSNTTRTMVILPPST